MSKGLGRTQRAILALIAAQPDEAWDLEALCRAIYPGDPKPSRSQLGATVRALKMPLPGQWKFGYVDARRRWLYDASNLDAVAQRMWRLETFELTYDELGKTTTLLELTDVSTEIALTDLPGWGSLGQWMRPGPLLLSVNLTSYPQFFLRRFIGSARADRAKTKIGAENLNAFGRAGLQPQRKRSVETAYAPVDERPKPDEPEEA